MVTPVAPVKVVKKVQSSVAATAAPPGTGPKSALKSRTSRRLVPPSESSMPTTVKIGMVGKIGEATMR